MPESASDTSLTAIAAIRRPVGLDGGLRVTLLCDGPDRLRQFDELHLGPDPKRVRSCHLRAVEERPREVVIWLEECADRTQAESLRGQYLFVTYDDAPPPSDDVLRLDDLLGSSVCGPDGEQRGILKNVYKLPGHDVWGVWNGDREVLIPAVDAWIGTVDREAKIVTLRSAELFEDL